MICGHYFKFQIYISISNTRLIGYYCGGKVDDLGGLKN